MSELELFLNLSMREDKSGLDEEDVQNQTDRFRNWEENVNQVKNGKTIYIKTLICISSVQCKVIR